MSKLRDAIFSIASVSLVILTILIFTAIGLYKDRNETLLAKMETITNVEGVDISLLCNIAGCEYVMAHGTKYYNELGILVPCRDNLDLETVILDFNKSGYSVVEFRQISFLINNQSFFSIVNNLIVTSMVLFVIVFSILYLLKAARDAEIAKYKNTTDKQKLENMLQRDLTESLHHELSVPIEVIKSLVIDLFRKLYPCNSTERTMCKGMYADKNNLENCEGCNFIKGQREIDYISMDHYRKIMLSIETLTAIKDLVSDSKHIKYSNGTVAIKDIIENTVSKQNAFSVSKAKLHFDGDMRAIENHACGRGLPNGEMMIILGTLVTNALEAKSKNITFRVRLLPDSKLSLLVIDDGIGIRDKNNKVIKDYKIFDYGYSTKDGYVNPPLLDLMPDGVLKMLSSLGICEDVKSQRGSGLAIATNMTRLAGGNISLVETSHGGTKFELIVPVKVRRDTHGG